MKKTLIALAAIAATSAFAQSSVSLTGNFTAGYERTSTAAGVSTGGIGIDTAEVRFTAVEDLGGGMTATATMLAGNLFRSGAFSGGDATLALAGGFGRFVIGAVESAGSGVHQIAGGGVPGYDLQGKVFGANVNLDTVSYTSPQLMTGLTVGIGYVDYGTATNTGLNAGTEGVAFAQPSWTINATYSNGPIMARLDTTSWTRQLDATTGLAFATVSKDRYRLSGTYDFGVAKLGLGYSQRNFAANAVGVTANSVNETTIGLSAPIGPVKIGMNWGRSDNSTNAARSGYTLGAQYDLSKRTNVGVSMYNWKTDNVAGDNTGFRTFLSHSF